MAINEVYVFGDSFMYGEETYQHHFDQSEFLQTVASVVDRKEIKLNDMGMPEPNFDNRERNLYMKFMADIKARPDTPGPNYYSIGNLLATELNVPCHNLAYPGNSNNIILKDFIYNLDNINKNTLILVGISDPKRKSYYNMNVDQINKDRHCSTSCWSHIHSNRDFQKYIDLDYLFGDDATAQVLQTYAYVMTIKSLANRNGCSEIYFIDPFNYFCPNKYHPDIPWRFIQEKSTDTKLLDEYAHNKLLEQIKKELSALFIRGFDYVFESVQNDRLPVQCLNGHYSKYTYKKYIDAILLPLIRKDITKC